MAHVNAHHILIRRCIELAQEAAHDGDEPFAALLAFDDKVVLTAQNRVVRERDRTRHAELILVSQALRDFDADMLQNATVYASTEPCIMCAAAIYWSRIPRLVFGCSQSAFAHETGCAFTMPCREIFAAGSRSIEVIGPVLEDEALAIHRSG